MLRGSNAVIGSINFVTFLISIPILGSGIWLSGKANTDCLRFLQWPIIIIGVALMVVSLAGFAGACYRITWLLRLYLFAMFLIIAALIGFVIFAFSVTGKGGGQPVPNRGYEEYDLSGYSGWLKDRVEDPGYWRKISSCLRGARVCQKVGRFVKYPVTGVIVAETVDMFNQRQLSPVEPPTSCGFTYVNETVWNPTAGPAVADADCTRWSNDQQMLCYNCDSCKAGVLSTIRKSWRKASIINVVVLVILVIVYVIAIAAYRNAKRADNDEGYGVNRMTKSHPTRFQF